MALRWDPWALPGAASLLLGLLAAGFVLATRPDRAQNRWLAATLALTSALSSVVSLELAVDPRWREWGRVMLVGPTLILVPLVYLSFLSTLPARLARPLRWPAFRAALAAYTAVLLVAWFARGDLFVERVGERADGSVYLVHRSFVEPLLLGHLVLAGLAGAAVAVSALASARAPLARRQMRAYALAFVARDLLLVLWAVQDASNRAPAWPHEWRGAMMAGVDAAFILALAYGILSAQLFDIDRRVQAAAARVVLAAMLVLGFVLATEGAEALVAEEAGGLAALALAAVLAFAFAPLERLARRLVQRVIPAEDDPAARRAEIYRAAVEGAMEDGEVTPRERAMLERLRGSLGLPPSEAAEIEGAMRARPAAEGEAAA